MRLQKPPRQWKSSNFHASSIGIPSPSRQYEMIAIQEEEEPRTTARPETEYEGHITVPAQWPTNPRKLQKWKPLNLLTDIFSLAFVAPFVVLICLVIIGNQRTALQSDWQRIQLAKNLSVTIFPLIFSAVVGKLTKRIAAWRLGRGNRLQPLEQLNGSSTLVNTRYPPTWSCAHSTS